MATARAPRVTTTHEATVLYTTSATPTDWPGSRYAQVVQTLEWRELYVAPGQRNRSVPISQVQAAETLTCVDQFAAQNSSGFFFPTTQVVT